MAAARKNSEMLVMGLKRSNSHSVHFSSSAMGTLPTAPKILFTFPLIIG